MRLVYMFAYLLASFNPGTERDAYDDISVLPKVKDINLLFGEWDVIAKIEIDGPGELERFLIDKIRVIPGIKLTSTMIVAK